MNLPNKLTLMRICLVPLYIACFYIKVPWAMYASAGIFTLAFITDIADGYIARSRGLVTDFGKLADPMADKLLTASALIMLTARGLLNPIAVIIILAREFIISGVRLVTAGRGVVIAASRLGKLKTLTQATAMVLAMLGDVVTRALGFRLDVWMLWISVMLALVSGADYIAKNYKSIDFK